MGIKTATALIAVILVGSLGWFFLQKGTFSIPQDGAAFSQDVVYEEEKETYSIHATYPPQPSIEREIKEAIGEFKELADPANLTEQEREWAVERPYTLEITYKSYVSSEITSYVFSIYSDTGGAHPNAFFRTFAIDERGEELLLENLFAPGAPYLSRISEKVYAGVLGQLEERTGAPVSAEMQDTVRIGTSPTPETLQFFYLDEDVLHIIIPPYQAASYAAGYFDVPIPLSDFKDILR